MKLLNEILGTKYPIIQGGMANIATGEFAAACSNAGALGLIGGGGMHSGDELRQNIRRCRELTDKPFGVNIMLMHPCADEFAQIVVEEKVPVVTTGAGNPGQYVAKWKAAGITVIPVVAAAVLAKHLAKTGVDAVIAEGTESGGHVGEMTTMALVPQVVDAVDIPVIAAGGIADGRQLAAAFALGACGAQVGTCLLVAEECPIHENYKAALLKAKDSDTIVTGRIGGTPVRVLKNKMAREYVRQEKAGADKMELEKFTLGSLRRAVFDGDTDTGSLMAGQVAGMLHDIRPVAEILAGLMDGCKARLGEMEGHPAAGSAGAPLGGIGAVKEHRGFLARILGGIAQDGGVQRAVGFHIHQVVRLLRLVDVIAFLVPDLHIHVAGYGAQAGRIVVLGNPVLFHNGGIQGAAYCGGMEIDVFKIVHGADITGVLPHL